MRGRRHSGNGKARGKTALCLCGGGITGAMYEIGALAALDDLFDRAFNVTQFDIIVGTSAGASVGSLLATGVRPQRMLRAMLDPDDDFFGLTRNNIFTLEPKEILGILRDLTKIGVVHAARAARGKFSSPELSADLQDALPAGLFSLEDFESFLTELFKRHGLPTDFKDIRRQLYITANDLDSGHRVVFGERNWRDVPIPRAIIASSAIPVFFEPVRIRDRDFIDGGAGKVAHADIAIRHGARLVFIISPMVPARNIPARGDLPTPLSGVTRLRDKGFVSVWMQSARMNTKTKLYQALRRWRAQRPDVTFFLLEPDEREASLFFANSMNFAVRRRMVRYGYDSTARIIRMRSEELASAFARSGVKCDVEQLRRDPWQVWE